MKSEIVEIAQELKVSSYAHYRPDHGSEWIFVDPDREAADIYIVNHIQKGDVVMT